MAMVKAHLDLNSEADEGPKDTDVVIYFVGSGASDSLTYGHIKNFLEENGWNTGRQKHNDK
jgi:hypothetical protein